MSWADNVEDFAHIDATTNELSTIGVGPIGQTLSAEGEPVGESGQALEGAFPRFADDLMWWVDAAKVQRERKQPPY